MKYFGSESASHQRGFTLLEVLVVLIVIGVVISLVVLNVDIDNRERGHDRYRTELENFVLEAYAQSRLYQQDHALHWYHETAVLYTLTLGEDEFGDPVVVLEEVDSWSLPDTLEFALTVGEQRLLPSLYSEDPPPAEEVHVGILPDGIGDTPWTLELVWRDSGEVWQRLVSDGFNRPQWRLPHE